MNEKETNKIFHYYQLLKDPHFRNYLSPYFNDENFDNFDIVKSLTNNKNHDVVIVDVPNVAHNYIKSASHENSYVKFDDNHYQVGILLSLARFVRLLGETFPYALILLATDDPNTKHDKYQRKHEIKSDLNTEDNFVDYGNSDEWINTTIDHITLGRRPYRIYSPGAEADDSIKSVVKIWKGIKDKSKTSKMIMISGDHDVASNISSEDNIHVISQYNLFLNTNNGYQPLNNEVLEEDFIGDVGIEPVFYPYYKIMIGKESDGYEPLAPARSVISIINRFTDVDDIQGNLNKLIDYFKSVSVEEIISRAHEVFKINFPLMKKMLLKKMPHGIDDAVLNEMFNKDRSGIDELLVHQKEIGEEENEL